MCIGRRGLSRGSVRSPAARQDGSQEGAPISPCPPWRLQSWPPTMRRLCQACECTLSPWQAQQLPRYSARGDGRAPAQESWRSCSVIVVAALRSRESTPRTVRRLLRLAKEATVHAELTVTPQTCLACVVPRASGGGRVQRWDWQLVHRRPGQLGPFLNPGSYSPPVQGFLIKCKVSESSPQQGFLAGAAQGQPPHAEARKLHRQASPNCQHQ